MGKNRSTKKKINKSESGRTTSKQNTTNSDAKNIVWAFDMIDLDGSFSFDVNRTDFDHKEILSKIVSYNSMTWAEIKRHTHDNGKSKHHLLNPDSLSQEAKNRIISRKLSEYEDSIFSFALQNKLRVVGIRKNEFFHVLWYDPEHQVCPSHKK